MTNTNIFARNIYNWHLNIYKYLEAIQNLFKILQYFLLYKYKQYGSKYFSNY